MDKLIIKWSCLFLFILISSNIVSQNIEYKGDSVEIITEFPDLYHYHNFYIAGQVSLEALKWLKSKGVTKIINLRTQQEMTEFTKTSYNEALQTKKMGFDYYIIEVLGLAGYNDENLQKFIPLINADEKILIHCMTGIRANDFFIAYLIKKQGYSIEEALKIGRQIKFLIPLEHLLNEKITKEK